jgi:hypothetical protein
MLSAILDNTNLLGNYYKDFYNVIIDWESKADWNSVLVSLKKEFIRYQQYILQLKDANGNITLSGTNSRAMDGNILEAANLALNPFDKHYIDRDLTRTGLSIVVITAGIKFIIGTGVFNVDKKLCRLTTQRMIDNGVSLDLVCLSKPPLHSVPVFCFQSKTFQVNSPGVETEFKNFSGSYQNKFVLFGNQNTDKTCQDHLYLDDDIQNAGYYSEVYMNPDWVDISFWDSTQSNQFPNNFSTESFVADQETEFIPSCKMYEIQMMGMMDQEGVISIPSLDIFNPNVSEAEPEVIQLCTDYDMSLFRVPDVKQIQTPKPKIYKNLTHDSDPNLRLNFGKSPHFEESHVSINTQFNNERLGSSVPKYSSTLNPWGKDVDKHSVLKRRSKDDFSTEAYNKSAIGTTSIKPIKIIRQSQHQSRDFEPHSHHSSLSSDHSRRSFQEIIKAAPSPSKTLGTPKKTAQFLRHNYVNPFSPHAISRVGINDRRWEHIPKWVSHDRNMLFTNWDSLCRPACLPLTIEYFPSENELSEYYQEYTYTVSPAFDDYSNVLEKTKIESLLVELISQRLAQGFQLIVPPATDLNSILKLISIVE